MHPGDRDPGWRPALKGVILAPIVPFLVMLWQRQSERLGLVRLRTLVVGSLASLVIFLSVLSFLGGFGPVSLTGRAPLFVLFVAGSGVYAILAPRLLPRTPSRPETPHAYAAAYRARFFVTFAMAQTPALFGFVATFIVQRWWIYLLGLPFTLVALARVAPTRSALARADAELRAGGATFSVYDALAA